MKQIYCISGTSCNVCPLDPRKIIKKSFGSIVSIIVISILFASLFIQFTHELNNPPSPVLEEDFQSFMKISSLAFWIVILILFSFVFYQALSFRLYFYDISNDNIVIKKGVIARGEIIIQYHKIQNVFVDQDFMDRILGLYDVHIATADMQSIQMAHIDGVIKSNSEALRSLLLEKMKQNKDFNQSI